MGIEVLPPDVNESENDFAPAKGLDGAIRYGLSAVRNVGEGAVGQIIDARRGKGVFASFGDFCRKVEPSVLTKRVLESLIFAGAFDSLGYARRALIESQDKVSGPILAERKAEAAGQFSLFGGDSGVTEVDESVLDGEEFDKRTLLREEKEVLGQFVTDHPLLGVQDLLATQTTHEIGDLESLGDGDLVTIGGIIGSVQRKYTKRSEPYAQFRLEGLAGGAQVLAFPSVYEAVPGLIEADLIVLVSGRIDLRGRELQIRANEIREPKLGTAGVDPPPRRVEVDLPAAACTPAVLAKVKELLEAHPGSAAVQVRFRSSDGVTPVEVGSVHVDPSGSLLGELHALLGVGAARIGDDGPD
jgi:DNA polymerase-3 subunit alpha